MHSILPLTKMLSSRIYSLEPPNSFVMAFSMDIMQQCLPMVLLGLEKLTRTFHDFIIIFRMLGTEDKPGIMF